MKVPEISKLIKLNLGCGAITPKDWINIDSSINAQIQKIPFLGKSISKFLKLNSYDSKNITYLDLNKKWPFKNNSIDIIYSSHLFEHLSKNSTENFLKESYRCLKNEGIFRIVVPDLYKICKSYIIEYETTEKNNINSTEYIMWALNLHKGGQYKENANIIKKIIDNIQGYPHQHKYMYDTKSLTYLLLNNHFSNINEFDYGKSQLIYDIADVEGTKESYLSIYLEAIKA